MSPEIIGVFGLLALFSLLAVGVPIAFAMAGVGLVGYTILGGIPGALVIAGTTPFTTVNSYEMSVIPLFILMGGFAVESGISKDAYSATHAWFGRLPGGLAIATIMGCAGFAACTGSSIASVSVMTKMALPEMQRFKYDTRLATGAIAGGSTLGILIPPSIPLIIYGLIAEVSIGKLFMAGIFPGILLTGLFITTIVIKIRFQPSLGPRGLGATWGQKLAALKGIWPLALLILIVVAGIWGGFFTPLEAGGMSAFIAFLIYLSRQKPNLRTILDTVLSSIRISTMIFAIMIGAFIFNYFIAISQLPLWIAEFAGSLSIAPTIIVLFILVFYLIGGCFMEVFGLMMLTLPIFIPIVSNLGYDLILFGVLTIITIEMALITPPIGLSVFIINAVAENVPISTIYRGIIPFLLAMIVGVAIIITFPQIALYLPSIMIR